MKTVYFHNPGQLDIRGATTMGLSAKEDESSAIGKFGTGLKYAIASILRWNGAIEIETGDRKFSFDKEHISFRGRAHEQIIMTTHNLAGDPIEAVPLGYTTHYGSHWEPWQIFRELYANAKDENGGVSSKQSELGDVPYAGANATLITVTCPEVAECYLERDTIILPQQGTPQPHDLYYDTHLIKRPSAFLYYRGVRVRRAACLYTWNLTNMITLTEDRTISDTWYYTDAMAYVIQGSDDFDFIFKCLTATDRFFESEARYNSHYTTTPTFLAAARQLYKQEGKAKLPGGVWSILVKAEPSLDHPEPVQLTKVQQAQLDRAIELVNRMGYSQVHDYPISVVDFQKNTLGMFKNNQIFLSPQVFEQGTKQVVSTLFEEVFHAVTGLMDCTYEMQTRLFNIIISLYEEHVFEEAC